jgi:hypothetical protein
MKDSGEVQPRIQGVKFTKKPLSVWGGWQANDSKKELRALFGEVAIASLALVSCQLQVGSHEGRLTKALYEALSVRRSLNALAGL